MPQILSLCEPVRALASFVCTALATHTRVDAPVVFVVLTIGTDALVADDA
jgi:hypothetical protein